MRRSFLQRPPSPSPGKRPEDSSHNKYTPRPSLVKYHIPVILLPPSNEKKNNLNNEDERLAESKDSGYTGAVMPWKRFSPGTHSNNKQRAEDLLNDILPPREIVDGGRVWVQRVSSAPVEPYEVTRVKERLELQMLQRDASSEGICPVRRELYDQCFDELVRQVTLTCPERGLLLARVRDESRMTLSIYRALCEHAAVRTQRLEDNNEDLVVRLNDQRIRYEAEINKLRRRLSEEKARYEAEVARKAKKETSRDVDVEKRREELDFRKKCEEIITQLEMAPVSGCKTL